MDNNIHEEELARGNKSHPFIFHTEDGPSRPSIGVEFKSLQT